MKDDAARWLAANTHKARAAIRSEHRKAGRHLVGVYVHPDDDQKLKRYADQLNQQRAQRLANLQARIAQALATE